MKSFFQGSNMTATINTQKAPALVNASKFYASTFNGTFKKDKKRTSIPNLNANVQNQNVVLFDDEGNDVTPQPLFMQPTQPTNVNQKKVSKQAEVASTVNYTKVAF